MCLEMWVIITMRKCVINKYPEEVHSIFELGEGKKRANGLEN